MKSIPVYDQCDHCKQGKENGGGYEDAFGGRARMAFAFMEGVIRRTQNECRDDSYTRQRCCRLMKIKRLFALDLKDKMPFTHA